jgi:hypothetical protein
VKSILKLVDAIAVALFVLVIALMLPQLIMGCSGDLAGSPPSGGAICKLIQANFPLMMKGFVLPALGVAGLYVLMRSFHDLISSRHRRRRS